MFAAVSLGVFDRLGDGAADVTTLARKLGANADALERLLDSCVSLGLLTKENALYSNTPVAATYLTRSSPNTLSGYILYSDRALYPLWGNLEAAIREGTNRWEQTFGGEGVDLRAFLPHARGATGFSERHGWLRPIEFARRRCGVRSRAVSPAGGPRRRYGPLGAGRLCALPAT